MIKLILFILLLLLLFYFIYFNNFERFENSQQIDILNDKSINSKRICIFKKIPILKIEFPNNNFPHTCNYDNNETNNKLVSEEFNFSNKYNIKLKYSYFLLDQGYGNTTPITMKLLNKTQDIEIVEKKYLAREQGVGKSDMKDLSGKMVKDEYIFKSTDYSANDKLQIEFNIENCRALGHTLKLSDVNIEVIDINNYDIDIECINAEELLSSLKNNSRVKAVCLDGECINSDDIKLLKGEESFKLVNKSQKNEFKGMCIGTNENIKLRRCGYYTRTGETKIPNYDFNTQWYNRMKITALQSASCKDRGYDYKLEIGKNNDINLKRKDKKQAVSDTQKIIAGLGSHK